MPLSNYHNIKTSQPKLTTNLATTGGNRYGLFFGVCFGGVLPGVFCGVLLLDVFDFDGDLVPAFLTS